MNNIINDISNAFQVELILLIAIFLNVIFSLFCTKQIFKLSKWLSIIFLLVAIASLANLQIEPELFTYGKVFFCNLSVVFFKLLTLVCALLTTLMSKNFINKIHSKAFEFFIIILFLVLCSCLCVGCNNLLILFFCLESIFVSFAMLSTFKTGLFSKVAAFEFLKLNLKTSSLFLLPTLGLYLLFSTFNINEISILMSQKSQAEPLLSVFSTLFLLYFCSHLGILIGTKTLCKFYESTSFVVCALYSFLSLIVIYAVLCRFKIFLFDKSLNFDIILTSVALISIAVLSLALINTKKIKHMTALSVSLVSSFLLLGLLSNLQVFGVAAIVYNLIISLIMLNGLFASLILFNSDKTLAYLSDYTGIVYYRPFYSIAFAICLASFANLPPTAGFVSKFFLFSAISRSGFFALVPMFVCLVLSTFSIYFYSTFAMNLFARKMPVKNLSNKLTSPKIILYLSAILLVFLCFYSEKLIQLCILVGYEM